MKIRLLSISFILALISCFKLSYAGEKIVNFEIKPSKTDPEIRSFNSPHIIQYDKLAPQGKLLLFLSGTGGKTEDGPEDFLKVAIKQGYRVINLSYVDTPAVWMVCGTKTNVTDGDCAEKFRLKRIFGENTTPLISDEPQDAIMNRFTKLLEYLVDYDKNGNWGFYLENNVPKWNEIAIAGHSQGGSMAAFIAKRKLVARVITFSGGADHGYGGKLADWFFQKSITPPGNWYGAYHVAESTAKEISKSFKALAIPDNHVFPLSSGVRPGKKAHGEVIRNLIYEPQWIEMLGKGN